MRIPNFIPRDYQLPVWRALESGCRRAAPIWPRRAGKDTISLHWSCTDAQQHIGNYWHLFPEQTQARKAIWNGVNKEGRRIIDEAFPKEIRENTLDNEMLIKFKSGSTWQLGGSDRYDALVGSNPRGVVFSEYAIANPRAYDFVRPILAENGGWALFPFTPRGRNHGFDLYQKLQKDIASFAEVLTCDDTRHMTPEALALERAEMSEELFLQEYYGSFDFGIEGAYYAKYMNTAYTEGRFCDVPYDQSLPVWAGGDIGLSDSTAIWFWQVTRAGRINWIDYLEAEGQQVKYYVDQIKAKDYSLAGLFLPHDANHKRIGMPRTVAEQFRDFGLATRVLPVESNIQPGIEACRVAIGSSRFDEQKTAKGRSSLSAYRREYDDKRGAFKLTPLHDWASNGADGFRYAVQAINKGYCELSDWGKALDYSALNRAAI